MDLQFETIERWPYGGNGTGDKRATFRASYPKTVDLLKTELEKIGARRPALQTGHQGSDIRFDGLPRVNARTPRFAGVCLTFEKWRPTGQKNEAGKPLGTHDLLQFPCATFDNWEDNIRAIALTLKALRMSKLYGVGTETLDEHYAGFRHKRVEAQTGTGNGALTLEGAAAVLAACAEGGWTAQSLLLSAAETEAAYKAAAMKAHPDHGGTEHAMAKVNEAAAMLRRHFDAKAAGAA